MANTRPSYRTDKRGVRQVLDVKRYRETHPASIVATCGTCGRSWDDAHIAGPWTPTPMSRCPFEGMRGCR